MFGSRRLRRGAPVIAKAAWYRRGSRMASRILVVEPSAPVVSALSKHLAAGNHEVDAVDRAQALARFRPDAHRVVLLGHELSELIASIKARSPLTPVVLLFGPEHDDAFERTQKAGADSLLIGPLKKAAVLSVVACMLRQRDLLQERAPGAGQGEERTEPGRPLLDDSATQKVRVQRNTDLVPALSATPPLAGREGYDFDFFKKLLLMEIKRSKRYRYPISLALVELDASTTAGMEARDRARLMGELLLVASRAVRDIDLPLLFGDEKFLVFLPHTPGAGALHVARRLCEHIRHHAGVRKVTASAGVASYEGEKDASVSFGTLTKAAGEALKRAQAAGGDRAERSGGGSEKRGRVSLG